MLIESVVVNVKLNVQLPLIPNWRSLHLDPGHELNRTCLDRSAFGTRLRSRMGLRFLLPALGLAFLLSAPALSQALAPEAASPEQHAPHRYRKVTLDDQVKGLAKSLDLNEAQQAAVKRILEQRQQEILHITHAFSGSDRLSQLRALQVRTVEQIRTVLNDEQKKKYDPLGQRPPQQTSPQPSVEDWLKATTLH